MVRDASWWKWVHWNAQGVRFSMRGARFTFPLCEISAGEAIAREPMAFGRIFDRSTHGPSPSDTLQKVPRSPQTKDPISRHVMLGFV